MTINKLTEIRDAEAEKQYPKDINFREECDNFKCGAAISWREGFKAGFDCRDKLDNEALKIAVEALNYYASKSLGETGAWSFRKNFCFDLCQAEDLDFLEEPIGEKGRKYAIGGKTARGALAEIRKLRGDV